MSIDKGSIGSHWCSVVFDSKKNMYVYDSFARPSKKLLPYLYDMAKKKDYKVIDVQIKNQTSVKKVRFAEQSVYHGFQLLNKFGIESARSI